MQNLKGIRAVEMRVLWFNEQVQPERTAEHQVFRALIHREAAACCPWPLS